MTGASHNVSQLGAPEFQLLSCIPKWKENYLGSVWSESPHHPSPRTMPSHSNIDCWIDFVNNHDLLVPIAAEGMKLVREIAE